MNERIPKVYECAGDGGTEPGESSFTADGGSSRETFVRILGIITLDCLDWAGTHHSLN